jgi:hypothetical protein
VLRQEATRVNLPAQALERWEALLESRSPDDDELGVIQDDLSNTPLAVQNAIRANLVSPTVSLDVLVPRSEEYYNKLVGPYEDGQALEDFVKCVASPLMKQLIEWRPFEGYQLALLLASQPILSAALDTVGLETRELIKVYDWLTANGDALSRTAAIETGLFRAQTAPELREPLFLLIQAFVNSIGTQQPDPHELLSSLIVVVDGEIARSRVLASRPPYWRRLAAIAQAVLIARCVSISRMDVVGLAKWAMAARWNIFLLQCFVDLRLEPRWLPEFILSDQLKHEPGGRTLAAATAKAAFVAEAGWNKLLLDDLDGSLKAQLDVARVLLPGPLDGGIRPQLEIPVRLLAKMQSDLSESAISAVSFSTLVNGSFLLIIPSEIADLAADAIARADYLLECRDDQARLDPYLRGLARVAAVTRNHKLADALFVLLRKYRRLHSEQLSVEVAFRVAMIACSSRSELSEWSKCVGNCMIDLAFQPITREEAKGLHWDIVNLCHLVPELWATCGQAEAALRSVLNI